MPQKLPPQENLIFQSRRRLRHWRAIAGVFHLLTLCLFTFALARVLPDLLQAKSSSGSQASAPARDRQDLIETMDRIVRYQKYFKERNGRYTRDLGRLGLPDRLASGSSIFDVFRHYEVSILEAQSHRFVLLAQGMGSTDRVTIDEKSRLRANFTLPPLGKSYLLEEAERIVNLRASGEDPDPGLVSEYFNFKQEESGEWVALGNREPVMGEKISPLWDSAASPLFSSVRGHLENRLNEKIGEGAARGISSVPRKNAEKNGPIAGGEEINSQEAISFLEKVQAAQWIHKKERGRFASRWEELLGVSNLNFERIRAAKNVRLLPIEVGSKSFRITLEGTEGELLGEQFVASDEGAVRQVRYTEALVEQLQQTTNLLGNFQINPVGEGKKTSSKASP